MMKITTLPFPHSALSLLSPIKFGIRKNANRGVGGGLALIKCPRALEQMHTLPKAKGMSEWNQFLNCTSKTEGIIKFKPSSRQHLLKHEIHPLSSKGR